ncbi:hypothetical protein [Paludisphaera mucosa]|uniref:Uncharacterized protein n=1 Tax=Paludisphaera mucosa TaxID=3030827 RepID=A0ABT6FL84_9BACT|nr:hypothetical protein [Paludisphaera mucosa]MDG3008261.1 hypothetical protein [Paludisphaera mucosa]
MASQSPTPAQACAGSPKERTGDGRPRETTHRGWSIPKGASAGFSIRRGSGRRSAAGGGRRPTPSRDRPQEGTAASRYRQGEPGPGERADRTHQQRKIEREPFLGLDTIDGGVRREFRSPGRNVKETTGASGDDSNSSSSSESTATIRDQERSEAAAWEPSNDPPSSQLATTQAYDVSGAAKSPDATAGRPASRKHVLRKAAETISRYLDDFDTTVLSDKSTRKSSRRQFRFSS